MGMKVYELFNDNELEEGRLARWAGILGLGAAAALGNPSEPASGTSNPNVSIPSSQTTSQAKTATPKPATTPVKKPVSFAKVGTNTASKANLAMQNLLKKEAYNAGIRGVELAAFLAQTAHESGGFNDLEERNGGANNHFDKYDIKGNPTTAAKLGNTVIGDGEKYKGRGFIHLTGRANYEKAAHELDIPALVYEPELAATPNIAARIAIWFWKNKVRPTVKNNWNNVELVTYKINPNLLNITDRASNFAHYKKILSPPIKKIKRIIKK